MGESAAGDDRGEKAQRLRITYARDADAGGIGQLDLTRVWEEALTAAGVALSYSRGNRPRPRITVAAGLPMGVTSDGELLDVVTARPCSLDGLLDAAAPHLPRGFRPLRVREVGMGLPSLPAATRWADYEVDVPGADREETRTNLAELLAAESVPWEDSRGQKVRRYDLRPLISDLAIHGRCGDALRLRMRLRCATDGVGRAEQVTKALGLPEPLRIHRRRLVLAEESPARTAWRRRGRYL